MLALLNLCLKSLGQDGMDNSRGLGPCLRSSIPHQKDLDLSPSPMQET